MPAAWPVRSSPAARQWAVVSAGLAPVLLTRAYLMAGILQPASYSPVRTTISAMAGQAGTDRWIMTGGILLVGGCYLVTAAGLTGIRASARALLIVAGLAGIGIATSPEPARGATPQHLAWTVLGAVTIAVWPAFAAPRTPARPLILRGYASAPAAAGAGPPRPASLWDHAAAGDGPGTKNMRGGRGGEEVTAEGGGCRRAGPWGEAPRPGWAPAASARAGA